MTTAQLARFKKLLSGEKDRILSSIYFKNTDFSVSQDDLADECDFAVSLLQQKLAADLKTREIHLLEQINSALRRIDESSFGTCLDCEEPIELKRLEARPVTALCLACKEHEEHREKIYA